jgi:uncharacterized protein involved in exopolysaccharide biosynthesis
MSKKEPLAKEVVIEVMRHFGLQRNYQVAKYFNVTPQTLSGWIKSGEIPPKHLIKYKNEILDKIELNKGGSSIINITDNKIKDSQKFSWKDTKNLIKSNIKILLIIPFITTLLTTIYVFFIATPVYTSISKVLPISEDGSSSSNFSGVAAQLGINIPLNIGSTVPWAEIYPEIVKSNNLLQSVLSDNYDTKKYGVKSLMDILVSEHGLAKYSDVERKNRALQKLRNLINISKDRISPVVTLNVEAFEPLLVADLSSRLIERSGQIQRELKTNRVKKKRLFIEERLLEVSSGLKNMEKELREFREFNRNISTSPSLQMKVQEMGREIDLQNSLYVTLKSQYEKAKIDEVERDDMVQIIDSPSVPSQLTSPRRGLSIFLSIFFGIFSSVFILYFRQNYMELNETS